LFVYYYNHSKQNHICVVFLQLEFSRVKRDDQRSYLVLDEVMMLKSPASLPIDFSHLGIVYILIRNSNGWCALEVGSLCFMVLCKEYIEV
jgi:hypothetical protein